MVMTTLTIDIDEDELRRLNEACAARGVTVQTAVYDLVRKFRSPKIFDKMLTKIKRKFNTWKDKRIFESLRKEAKSNGTVGMSMEEIDAEIALYRAGK